MGKRLATRSATLELPGGTRLDTTRWIRAIHSGKASRCWSLWLMVQSRRSQWDIPKFSLVCLWGTYEFNKRRSCRAPSPRQARQRSWRVFPTQI